MREKVVSRNRENLKEKVRRLLLIQLLTAGLVILASALLALTIGKKELILGITTAGLAVLLWIGRLSKKRVSDPICRILDTAESAMKNEYRAENMRVQAEMHALQSQINPHFLYNTLETIRGIAMTKGVEEIADMTEALSSLFRYSISKPGEMATLEEELKHVRSYLQIQQYRFPNKVVYHEEIQDPEVLSYRIPILTIQPIIENAISHGLEQKLGGGVVRFCAFMTDYHIVMRISDNGIGMEERRLQEIRMNLSGKDGEERSNGKRNFGIALRNVNQRLKFYYGEPYGLNVMSTKDVGTIVEVTLPLNENRNSTG